MKEKRLWLRTIILVLLISAVGYTVYLNLIKDESKLVQVGEPAPDFVLEDLNGNKVQLSDYKGQGVFLNFWGTWCKPCKKEMPYMENVYKDFKGQGVEILAVDIGETKLAVQKFVERYNLTFPILLDKKSEIVDLYNIGPIPTTIMIDKDGIIRKKFTGSLTEEIIREYMTEVKP